MTRALAILTVCVASLWPVLASAEDNALLVELLDGEQIDEVLQGYPVHLIDGIDEWGVYLVEPIPPATLASVETAMALDPRIEEVEPVEPLGRPEGVQETIADLDLGVTIADLIGQPALGLIGLDVQDETEPGGARPFVALLDTSVQLTHEGLQSTFHDVSYDIADGRRSARSRANGIDDDGDGLVDEAAHHATHVAGLIHLVAPRARIVAIRVLEEDGGGDSFDLIRGILIATSLGVDVICLPVVLEEDSSLVRKAIRRAYQQGIVVVVPVGNDAAEEVRAPADMDEVIAVAALDEAGERAWFSSAGEEVALSAPGVSMLSTYGQDVFARWDGTSFATPLAVGGVARLLERYPSLEPEVVKELLRTTAVVVAGSPDDNGTMGSGMLSIAALDAYAVDDERSLLLGKAGATYVRWSALPGAARYDVVRGALSNLGFGALGVELGAVDCLHSAPLTEPSATLETTLDPPPGEAFFYLFRTDGDVAFGTASGEIDRLATVDCSTVVP